MGTTSVYEEKPWLKYYPEGVPADVDIPDKSITQLFDEATDKWKDKTAIVFYGNKISYKDLRDKVDRLATALNDLGVRKGDIVAILLLNCPEFIIAFHALLKIGAVISPISPLYVSPEIKYQLENSGAKSIICQDILWEKVDKAGVELNNVILTNIGESLPAATKLLGKSVLKAVYQKMAVPSQSITMRKGFHHFPDLLKKYPPTPPKVEINAGEDLALLPYTGGTTDRPKGVMITHRNVVANLTQVSTKFWPLETGKEVVISQMGFYHIAGIIWGCTEDITQGWTQIILTNFAPDEYINSIITFHVTFIIGAPTMYEMLKDYDKTQKVQWKSLKFVASGADALHDITAKEWEARTGVQIHQIYGATEHTGSSMWSPFNKIREGAIGIPLPSVEAAIIDPEKDEFTPLGEIGEIVLKGPHIMKGYLGRPDAMKEVQATLGGEVWFRTGDLGKMDADGYFYIYDRKRDLIKYKGYRVHGRDVEEVIKTHPAVKEVGVVGIPDRTVGENIKAFVVLETDARGKVSESQIAEYCQDKLAHYKIPRIIEFCGELPKTDVGKVSRRELREMEIEE